jgi:hypothetical protein
MKAGKARHVIAVIVREGTARQEEQGRQAGQGRRAGQVREGRARNGTQVKSGRHGKESRQEGNAGMAKETCRQASRGKQSDRRFNLGIAVG